MTREQIIQLLEALSQGSISHAQAVEQVERATFADLGFALLDHQREGRTGFAEVIFGQGKTPAQLAAIALRLTTAHPKVLATRVDEPGAEAALKAAPGGVYNPLSRTLCWGLPPQGQGHGLVLVLAAGTSDLPAATEAWETARMLGAKAELIVDVGVAGLHRLLAHQKLIGQARAIVAAAGMEGALPTVVGGLARCPVVGLPTSVGYGAGAGGVSALLAMLNSCAPGVTVVNIDNGFGAGYAAARINQPLSPLEE